MMDNNEKKSQDLQIDSSKTESSMVVPSYKIIMISTVTIIIILTISGLMFYKLQQQITNLVLQANTIKQQQGLLDNNLVKVTMQTANSHNQLVAQLQKMQKKIQQLSPALLTSNQYLRLLQARHFLELAQIHAQWDTNLTITLALLEQVDNILHPLTSQSVLAIRQEIAQEIIAVQKIQPPNIVKILAILAAEQKNVAEDLWWRSPILLKGAPVEQKEMVQQNDWHYYWQQTLNSLKKLVVVRHNDQELTDLLSPTYQLMVQENLRLNLQAAQIAVLQHDTVAYQLALTQVINNLARFKHLNPAIVKMISQLQVLSAEQLQIVHPKIGKSLELLNQLIENYSSNRQ